MDILKMVKRMAPKDKDVQALLQEDLVSLTFYNEDASLYAIIRFDGKEIIKRKHFADTTEDNKNFWEVDKEWEEEVATFTVKKVRFDATRRVWNGITTFVQRFPQDPGPQIR